MSDEILRLGAAENWPLFSPAKTQSQILRNIFAFISITYKGELRPKGGLRPVASCAKGTDSHMHHPVIIIIVKCLAGLIFGCL